MIAGSEGVLPSQLSLTLLIELGAGGLELVAALGLLELRCHLVVRDERAWLARSILTSLARQSRVRRGIVGCKGREEIAESAGSRR